MLALLLLKAVAVQAGCQKLEYAPYSDKNTFRLHGLPYDYAALDPFMWEPQLFYHYNKTHQGLVEQLNSVVGWNYDYADMTVEDLLIKYAKSDAKLARYAGGHYSHTLWWWILAPSKCVKSAPAGALGNKISAQWGNFTNFQADFDKYTTSLFGSGWAWLCLDSSQVLQLKAKREEFSPLEDSCLPLLGADVWEHAYYLTYLQDRRSYATDFWSYIDWDQLEYFYEVYLLEGKPVPI
mmetsp:Transcript_29271/g.52345  ORF Transcript_29271/g.52345 Transcript_29271/m.52345 type:complete len:237 (-) Transcript_29271:41-751(-)